ncbi:DUF3617 domain-containing protein [Sphingomonas sp. HF-S4]|uniref:DUF3617 domain-containing protein n=1 Tax=Sphingomonas agrestis TaxID=3080540 RepID=A0ABU3Y2P2_9SPHN|nr:DUF3617 domain-containing protein [Sphingomonas sp. HF-S4]MDV3455643.1 DUF3617 domain-containing protein [Sphingomonas sp. HF-S4]
MKKLLLLAPLALAACNSGSKVEATNASVEEVANQVAASGAAPQLSPGRWEGSATILSMEIPGMPPEAAAQMKSAMGTATPFASCLTPEQAKKPAADFFAGGAQKDCTYEKFTMADGKLDAKMQCKSSGMTIDMTMDGKFASDNFQLAMTSKSAGIPGQPASAHTMNMKMEARRTGECNGTESKAPTPPGKAS